MENIKNLIYTIRGVKVMLDSDLAQLYGYTTKAFNQQVKNNIEKFDSDFRFQLTKEEYHEILRSKNLTSNTETNNSLSIDFTNRTKLRSKKLTLELENGEYFNADIAYNNIYNLANKSIFIIDNYIGIKTLLLIKNIRENIKVCIFSDNISKGLHQFEYDDFKKQYPNIDISFYRTNGAYHDKYIIIDYDTPNENIFHCGASSKDAGNKITSITKINDKDIYHHIVNILLGNPILTL